MHLSNPRFRLVRVDPPGAAKSWVLENRSGRMIDNEYPLGFRTSLHLKDLAIGLLLTLLGRQDPRRLR